MGKEQTLTELVCKNLSWNVNNDLKISEAKVALRWANHAALVGNGQTASFRYNVCHLLKSMCGNPGNQHVKTRACRKRWWTLETVLDAKLSHFLKSNYAKLFIPKVELSWIIMNYAELIHKIHIIIPCFFISTLNSLNTPRPHWAFQLGKSGSCCFSVMGGAKLANSAAFGEAWHCGIKYTNMHPASCTYPINIYIYII